MPKTKWLLIFKDESAGKCKYCAEARKMLDLIPQHLRKQIKEVVFKPDAEDAYKLVAAMCAGDLWGKDESKSARLFPKLLNQSDMRSRHYYGPKAVSRLYEMTVIDECEGESCEI